MEEGIALELGDGNMPMVGHWHPGKPIRKWWGLKVDKRQRREIATWRCTSCGYLESYAP
jgi:hypothetical protein